jgi:hypothetical protein
VRAPRRSRRSTFVRRPDIFGPVPLPIFELACVAIIVVTLVAMARVQPARTLLADYGALAVAAWLGEETCVAAYRFYSYSSAWHARLDLVPALVPLIWPLVILSARAVVTSLAPGISGARRAALVGALVIVDASLVEVVAVRGGLWTWAEGGHLGVPVVGIVGWGFFAAAADGVLGSTRRFRHAALVVLAPLATHALLVVSWWAFFRWVWRHDLGDRSVAVVGLLGVALTFGAIVLRVGGRTIARAVALPRMVAAALFVVEWLLVAPRDPDLAVHVAAVAIPYFVATELRARAPRAAAQPTR